MTLQNFCISILTYLAMFPAAILCLAPMKNHFRFKKTHTFFTCAGLILIISAVCSLAENYYSLEFSALYLPTLVILFIVYHKFLTLHISQSLGIFMMVTAFFSFLVNFSIMFDALRNPNLNLVDYSLSASAFLLLIGILFSSLTFYPMAKYGSYMLEHLSQARIYMVSVMISATFLLFNLRMVVHHYSTLHTNRVGIAYITVMSMMFVLFSLLCVIFYYIVNALVEKAQTDDRNHILEMQEKQYVSLQHYISADAKARHDFRQTIYTLKELSLEKDYQAIDNYLCQYIEDLPQKETTDFCHEPALNALLNHYRQTTENYHIQTDIQVSLPAKIYINSIDLCSIIGNILENAITACCDIPEKQRFIYMVISEEQGNELYIAVSNSYGGKLHQKKDRYLSTHKGGNGIGLISITATAEQYGGTAGFSHDDEVFYSDVMLVNRKHFSKY